MTDKEYINLRCLGFDEQKFVIGGMKKEQLFEILDMISRKELKIRCQICKFWNNNDVTGICNCITSTNYKKITKQYDGCYGSNTEKIKSLIFRALEGEKNHERNGIQ